MNKLLFFTLVSLAGSAAAADTLLSRYTFDRFGGLYEPDTMNGEKMQLKRDYWEHRVFSTREAGLYGNAVRLAPRAVLETKMPEGVKTIMFYALPEDFACRFILNAGKNLTVESTRSGTVKLNGRESKTKLAKDVFSLIAITVNGKNVTLSINGVEEVKAALPADFVSAGTLFVLRNSDQANPMKWKFDEIRFYQDALPLNRLKKMAGKNYLNNEKLPLADAGIAHSVVLGKGPVTLSGKAVNADKTEWKIVSAPAGSKAHLKTPDKAEAQFIPDKTGNYTLEFTASNADGVSRSSTRISVFADTARNAPGKAYSGKLKAGEVSERNDMAGRNPTAHYTKSFIEKNFPAPVIARHDEGFAAEKFKPAPPPYVHPRIFFNPEDLPAIRERLKNTKAGQIYYQAITSQVENRMRNYPDGKLPLAVVKDDNPKSRSGYKSDGNLAALLSDLAFIAMIEADADLARKLIDNMVQQAAVQNAIMDKVPDRWEDDWREFYHNVMGRTMTAMMYDFLYNYMTEEERQLIRSTLSRATRDKWTIGMNGVSAQGQGNWICWTAGDLLQNVVAIENEEGFPVESYRELVNTYKRWLNCGIFEDSGAAYEGMGKNTMTYQNLAILYKRGENLLNSKAAYNHAAKFMLHTLQPDNGYFCQDDLWGGSRNNYNAADVAVVKYAYPNDPAIDFVYRNCVGEDYLRFKPRGTTYCYVFDLLAPIFGEDHAKDAASPGKDAPLEYLASEINMMTARSGWDKDAAFLYFLPRMHGGHNSPARGTFVFAALGRDWSIYPTGHNDKHAFQHSVVTVDGKNQFPLEDSKMLSYTVKPDAVFGSCDLQYVYGGTSPKEMSNNDYRIIKRDLPWENLPKPLLPHWYTGNRPKDKMPRVKTKFKPNFQTAVRTAGLVRGKHSYALILDNFNADGKEHLYRWQMVFAPELEKSVKVNGNTAVITDPETGNSLLVSALANEKVNFEAGAAQEAKYGGKQHALSFSIKSDRLISRVLLIPVRKGEKLPEIKGNEIIFADGVKDKIVTGDVTDSGIAVKITRDGREIF